MFKCLPVVVACLVLFCNFYCGSNDMSHPYQTPRRWLVTIGCVVLAVKVIIEVFNDCSFFVKVVVKGCWQCLHGNVVQGFVIVENIVPYACAGKRADVNGIWNSQCFNLSLVLIEVVWRFEVFRVSRDVVDTADVSVHGIGHTARCGSLHVGGIE